MTDQTKNKIQELIGLNLTQTSRSSNMECLKFGFKTNDKNQNIGEFGLHIQTDWRIINEEKILIGSNDLFEPDSENQSESDFDYETGNLRDQKLDKIIKSKSKWIQKKLLLTIQNEEPFKIGNGEIFKIFYQTSADIIAPLTAAVGENVIITDDPQNNQLIVTASLQDLDKVDLSLQELDIQKRQVMVEAYIINATDNFTKAFNANLTLQNNAAQIEGRDRITFVGIDTNPSGTAERFTTTNEAGAVSNTVMDVSEDVAGGAFLLGNLGMTKLKAIINASNTDGNKEVISNPKLFAMDGESSTLVQGVELLKVIPAAGDVAGSTQVVPQNLTLNVTPRIRIFLLFKPGDFDCIFLTIWTAANSAIPSFICRPAIIIFGL